ncbi:MAG: DUF5103 domain-containing protein [Cyclobacteriaceae bacterium]|nr:DUF5103 domain-containing protein [Cyclobacteriaceae bacterium]
MRLLFIVTLVSLQTAFAQKKLIYADKSYEEEIRTVMLHPNLQGNRDNLRPSVAPLQAQNLVLEFDDLQGQRSNYYVKIIHCNYDWTKSTLQDLDYLHDYNEYPINEYEFSSSTSVSYVHYYFALPQVKLPGNYLLLAYRESEKDLLLSKRFMIYDNQVSLVTDSQSQGLGNLRTSNQQLSFKINYSRLDVVNPMQSIQTLIRQNQRWDNARLNVKPSFVREDRKELEFRFFDTDNQFMAGNEFRFVDFRSLNSPGRNTGRLDRSKRPFHISVLTDQSRRDQVYAQYPDLNGNYVIENLDNRDAATSGDYVFVTFSIAPTQTITGHVHLLGALTNWEHTPETKMTFIPNKNLYEKTLFLKQGWYDYQYWVEGPGENSFQLEGSHFETENLYEVLIYNRPFRPNADLLVGYYQLPVNAR